MKHCLVISNNFCNFITQKLIIDIFINKNIYENKWSENVGRRIPFIA